MGSVLLIGGAGFIGSHIAERLVEQGECIAVVDTFRRGRLEWLPLGVTAWRWDVRRPIQMRMDSEMKFDSVVNLASILIHESQANPKDGYDTNTIGALNSYLFARAVVAETFVQFSSASVYGEPNCVPTSEWTPRCPTTAYGYAKMDAEDHLMSMKYGPQLVMLRPYNVYGRRQSTLAAYTEVLPRWAEAVSKGEPMVVHGDGSQTMDLIHVTDVARLVTDFALKGELDAGVYNVGSGVETSVLELARACQVAWDAPGSTIVLQPHPSTDNRQKRRCADITCAKTAGWTPEVNLEDGLADYWEWWRKEAGL